MSPGERDRAGFNVVTFDAIGSTNDEARRLAAAGAADGTVVWARKQTSGRGRRGRAWLSPRGNLYCSVLLRPHVDIAVAAQFSLVTAVALAETFTELLPRRGHVQQKWPNDVLINGRKAAGILLESSGMGTGRPDWLIVGCGVNVARLPELPETVATSLHAEGAGEATPEQVLQAFLAHLQVWRRRWETEGMAPVRRAWLDRAYGLGERLVVRLPGSMLQGVFRGLDEQGALLLASDDGRLLTVTSGELFFGRDRPEGETRCC